MKDFHCTPSPHGHSQYKKCRKLFQFLEKYQLPPQEEAVCISSMLAVREHTTAIAVTALLRFTKIFKFSGIGCKQVNLRNTHKEGRDKQHNTTLKMKLK